MKYYALRCYQNGNIMNTGFNVTTLFQLKEELLRYIQIDLTNEEFYTISQWTIWQIAEMWQFEVLEMSEPFKEVVFEK